MKCIAQFLGQRLVVAHFNGNPSPSNCAIRIVPKFNHCAISEGIFAGFGKHLINAAAIFKAHIANMRRIIRWDRGVERRCDPFTIFSIRIRGGIDRSSRSSRSRSSRSSIRIGKRINICNIGFVIRQVNRGAHRVQIPVAFHRIPHPERERLIFENFALTVTFFHNVALVVVLFGGDHKIDRVVLYWLPLERSWPRLFLQWAVNANFGCAYPGVCRSEDKPVCVIFKAAVIDPVQHVGTAVKYVIRAAIVTGHLKSFYGEAYGCCQERAPTAGISGISGRRNHHRPKCGRRVPHKFPQMIQPKIGFGRHSVICCKRQMTNVDFVYVVNIKCCI